MTKLAQFTACGFIAAGLAHFFVTDGMARIVPPGLGDARLMVYLSGIAEISLGAALFLPRLRAYAALGLGLLLLCVWPANWYMAINAAQFRDLAPAGVLWARVPVQLLLLAGVGRIYRESKSS